MHFDTLLSNSSLFNATVAAAEVVYLVTEVCNDLKMDERMPRLIRLWSQDRLSGAGFSIELSPIVIPTQDGEPILAAWPVIRAYKRDVQVLVDIRHLPGETDDDLKKMALWVLENSHADQLYLAVNLAYSPFKAKAYFRPGMLGPAAGDECEIPLGYRNTVIPFRPQRTISDETLEL